MNIYELQATLRLDTGDFLRSAAEADAAFRSLGDGIGVTAEGMAEKAAGIAEALGGILGVFGGEGGTTLSLAAEGTAALLKPFDGEAGIRIGDAAGAFAVLRDALAELLPAMDAENDAQGSLNAALAVGTEGLRGTAEGLNALPALLDTAAGALGQWAADAAARWSESAGAAEGAGKTVADVLAGQIPEAVSSALGAAASLPGAFAEAGRQMASGLSGGFASVWESAAAGIRQKIGSLVDGVKDLLGIRSPSRVFADIGGNMVRGLSLGWESGFGEARDAVLYGIGELISSPASGVPGTGVPGTGKVDFADSALGRSSAAGIASLTAAESGTSPMRPVEIRLMLDGREAAEALYDPLMQAGLRRGGRIDNGWR